MQGVPWWAWSSWDELPSLLRNVHVEELVFARGQASQDSRLDRHRGDSIADALEVNLDRLDRLFFFFLFLLFRLLIAALCLRGLLLVFLFILLFVGCFFFIALGLERRSLLLLQGDREYPVGGVVVVSLVELPGTRIKIPSRNEKQIFSAGIEHRVVIVIEAPGNFRDFLRAERIKKNVARPPPVRLRIRKPQAVRRPTGVANVSVLGFVHQNRLLFFNADVPQLVQFVPIQEFLAVR